MCFELSTGRVWSRDNDRTCSSGWVKKQINKDLLKKISFPGKIILHF